MARGLIAAREQGDGDARRRAGRMALATTGSLADCRCSWAGPGRLCAGWRNLIPGAVANGHADAGADPIAHVDASAFPLT